MSPVTMTRRRFVTILAHLAGMGMTLMEASAALPGPSLVAWARELYEREVPTLATLHQQVLAVGAFWNRDPKQNQLLLAVSRRRRAWFEGLWANAGDPPVVPFPAKNG
jgi:hypothetical protein